jgi:uncharacterized membrane protein
MDSLHVHLLINHLPIAGTILGAFVLAFALGFKSKHTEIAAYAVFIISTIGAVISYLTGEGAEHAVKQIPGLVKSTIERHEDFSIYALIALSILGIFSLIGIMMTKRKSRPVGGMAIITFVMSLICFSLIAWTAYLGGQIRHTELSRDTIIQIQPYRDENLKRLP